jgi:hypothetical protein
MKSGQFGFPLIIHDQREVTFRFKNATIKNIGVETYK